jgi:hypothetical protein
MHRLVHIFTYKKYNNHLFRKLWCAKIVISLITQVGRGHAYGSRPSRCVGNGVSHKCFYTRHIVDRLVGLSTDGLHW